MKILEQWTIVLQISLLLLQPVTCSSNITCSAGVATIGGSATVTCYFNRDIRNSTFVIRKFPINTIDFNTISRKDVLSCNWVKGPSDCETATGYEFNGDTVTTTASVYIPSATADQEGIYECQLQTQEVIPIFTCNLTVQATEGNAAISNIDNIIISDLTPLGAFILIFVLIVVCVILIIALIIYCCKNMRKRRRETAAKIATRTVHRGTNTNPVVPVVPVVVECVEIAVNTDESSFSSKGKFWFRKDDKKNTSKQSTSKQSTPKRSQEDLAEKEEESPLLTATAPPQYGPTTDAKANDGQPTQEAVGGPSEAGAEVIDTKRVEIQMASGNTDDTAQDNTETDQYTAQNDNGKSKEKGKGRKGISLFKKK